MENVDSTNLNREYMNNIDKINLNLKFLFDSSYIQKISPFLLALNIK